MVITVEKLQVAIIVGSGEDTYEKFEWFGTISSPNHRGGYELGSLVREAVKASGRTSSRKDKKSVPVSIFKLVAEKGQLVRKLMSNGSEPLPLARMTEAEYNEEMDEATIGLPQEFAHYVRAASYDQGHSSGYEEVVGIARGIADELRPRIADYTKRITEVSKPK